MCLCSHGIFACNWLISGLFMQQAYGVIIYWIEYALYTTSYGFMQCCWSLYCN